MNRRTMLPPKSDVRTGQRGAKKIFGGKSVCPIHDPPSDKDAPGPPTTEDATARSAGTNDGPDIVCMLDDLLRVHFLKFRDLSINDGMILDAISFKHMC